MIEATTKKEITEWLLNVIDAADESLIETAEVDCDFAAVYEGKRYKVRFQIEEDNEITRDDATALANMIDTDGRNDAYDAHGLSRDDRGWYVCVNDTQATAANPDGRTLRIYTREDWETALRTR